MSSCCGYFCNLITLSPSNVKVTLTIDSQTGWYVLYPPSFGLDSIGGTPLPVYHIKGNSDYIDWTYRSPINCTTGSTNYITGLCELVYQRVEESPDVIQTYSREVEPTEKDYINLSGRFMKPKIYKSTDLGELYCFYQFQISPLKESKIKTTVIDKSFIVDGDWGLGVISYRSVPSQVIVSNKVFGSPLTASLTGVGIYNNLLTSIKPYSIPQRNGTSIINVADTNNPLLFNQIPSAITEVQPLVDVSYNLTANLLTIAPPNPDVDLRENLKLSSGSIVTLSFSREIIDTDPEVRLGSSEIISRTASSIDLQIKSLEINPLTLFYSYQVSLYKIKAVDGNPTIDMSVSIGNVLFDYLSIILP